MKKHLLFSILTLLVASSCIKKETESRTIVLSELPYTTDNIIADTIVYSVDIVNVDVQDEWAEWRLRNMQQQKLINSVFERVYAGEIEAYDYFTEEKLSKDEVQSIEQEEDFSRNRIEELQFEEIWLFNADEQIFHKEVLSLVMAYGAYTDDGIRLGLKPVFRIKFN